MNSTKTIIIPVREQIYNRIKKAILSNEYKPGDIIQIDRIAREFGVSATPIRETLIRLESSGLLKLVPNKGAQVVEITDKDIRDTWEMRKLLEPYAGRITAGLDINDKIVDLEGRIQGIIDGNYDQDAYIEADNDIHQLLFNNVDNILLKETINRIHNLSMRMRYQAENVPEDNKHVVHEVCSEHLGILKALKIHDQDATEKAIRLHLENGERRTLDSARRS